MFQIPNISSDTTIISASCTETKIVITICPLNIIYRYFFNRKDQVKCQLLNVYKLILILCSLINFKRIFFILSCLFNICEYVKVKSIWHIPINIYVLNHKLFKFIIITDLPLPIYVGLTLSMNTTSFLTAIKE